MLMIILFAVRHSIDALNIGVFISNICFIKVLVISFLLYLIIIIKIVFFFD